MDAKLLNILDVSKEPGVKDLPLRVRGPFAQAIIAERMGDHVKAAAFLDKAVAAEIELNS